MRFNIVSNRCNLMTKAKTKQATLTDTPAQRGPGRPKSIDNEVVRRYIDGLPGQTASAASIAQQLDISLPTLWRVLSALRADGKVRLLRADGERTAQWTTLTAAAHIADPGHLTKRVSYDFDRVGGYVPNKSQLLPPDIMDGLSKLATSAQTRSAADVVARVRSKLLVEMSWASSLLEGNEYSLGETIKLFNEGEVSDKKRASDTTMLLNHKDAICFVLDKIVGMSIDPFTVKNIHAMLSTGLLEDGSLEGQIRNHGVKITGCAYEPLADQATISREFNGLLETAAQINNPFEKSFFLLANLSYLQAFSDVNKRTARLVSNIPLMQNGLCPMSYYEFNKAVYEEGTVHYYETGATDRLAQAYLEGYSVSVDRYKDLLHHVGSSDDVVIRAEFRSVIHGAVRKFVLGADGVSLPLVVDAALEEAGKSATEPAKKAGLLRYVERVVDRLHEGQLVIYGLTVDDLQNFKDRVAEVNESEHSSVFSA